MNKIPKDPFRCILDYFEPVPKKRVSDHYNFNPEYAVNYTWPEQVSYFNPVTAVKGVDSDYGQCFKLQSGEKTDNTESNDGFK